MQKERYDIAELRREAKIKAGAGAGGMGGLGMGLMFGGPMVASVGVRMAEQQGMVGGKTAARLGGGMEQATMLGMLGLFMPGGALVKTGVTVALASIGATIGAEEGEFKYEMDQMNKAVQKSRSKFQKMANASAKFIETTEAIRFKLEELDTC